MIEIIETNQTYKIEIDDDINYYTSAHTGQYVGSLYVKRRDTSTDTNIFEYLDKVIESSREAVHQKLLDIIQKRYEYYVEDMEDRGC